MHLNLVPARTGVLWFKQGIATFLKQPLGLITLFFLYMLLIGVASSVPYIGFVLAMVLSPAAYLGLLCGAEEASHGRFPRPALLFTALRGPASERRHLLILGGLNACAFLLAVLVSRWVDGGGFADTFLMGKALPDDVLSQPAFLQALWTFAGLFFIIMTLFWLAPGLIHWHATPPLKSLFISMMVALRNFWAFAVLGLMWMGVLMGLTLISALVAALPGGSAIAVLVLLPLLIMLECAFFTSLYHAFADSFLPRPETAASMDTHTDSGSAPP